MEGGSGVEGWDGGWKGRVEWKGLGEVWRDRAERLARGVV